MSLMFVSVPAYSECAEYLTVDLQKFKKKYQEDILSISIRGTDLKNYRTYVTKPKIVYYASGSDLRMTIGLQWHINDNAEDIKKNNIIPGILVFTWMNPNEFLTSAPDLTTWNEFDGDRRSYVCKATVLDVFR